MVQTSYLCGLGWGDSGALSPETRFMLEPKPKKRFIAGEEAIAFCDELLSS